VPRRGGAGVEATIHASALVQGQTNTASTEKAAVYARVTNNDASSYSGTPYTHDGVAYEGQALMGSATGRIWAYDSLVSVPAGTDGQATGFETDIYNSGVPGVLDRPDAKIGYDTVCSGPNECTIGI
jgi:hypothetical protein